MKGTIVNVIAVTIGSLIGLYFNKHITQKIKKIIMQALGLSTLIIGISMGLKTNNFLIVIFSLVLGGIVGELLDIEKKLENFATFLKKKFKSREGKFVDGFVTSFLIFCVGALTIVGSIEDGINNDPTLLYTKSLLDGSASIALASGLGIGVLFSIIPLFLFQGFLTLGAKYFGFYLREAVITEMSAIGGVLIIGIGLMLLEIKKIKLSNLLPAIVVAAVLAFIF